MYKAEVWFMGWVKSIPNSVHRHIGLPFTADLVNSNSIESSDSHDGVVCGFQATQSGTAWWPALHPQKHRSQLSLGNNRQELRELISGGRKKHEFLSQI